MNLNHLAIFHAISCEGSITLGAERLHISQPAVSKQLHELEKNLGMPLFDRLPRGVRLTEAGELLAGYAHRLFGLEAEAEAALIDLQGLERGRLAVGASMTIGSYLLPKVLAGFQQKHPGIDIRLEIGNTEEVQRKLIEGTLDVGLTEGFLEHPELEAAVFREDEMVLITPPDHPLLSESVVTAERLCKEPFVVREEGSGTRAVVERAFAERGLLLRPAMSLGNIEAVKGAVAAGVGIAMVSALAVGLELEVGRLGVVPVSDLSVRRALHRLRLHGRHQSHTARAFTDALARSQEVDVGAR